MNNLSSGHYLNLSVKNIISRFSTYNGAFKAGVHDNKGWYRYRGNKRRLLNPSDSKDYDHITKKLEKRFLGTLNYFRPAVFNEWQKKPWNSGYSPGGLEDTMYYMLSIDVDLANNYTVDDSKAFESLKIAGKFIKQELSNCTDKFLILFSGNGIYFHLHPEFVAACETTDSMDKERLSIIQPVLDGFNNYLQNLEEMMFKKHPEIHGIVKIDAINGRKRVFKLPLTTHKDLPYIVYPIVPEDFDVQLKTLPLTDNDIEYAENIINDFFDELPTIKEQNDINSIITAHINGSDKRKELYGTQTNVEKPPVPIPIDLIKRESVCASVFSPKSWPKGNTRRVAFMVSVLRRCGWQESETKEFLLNLCSTWNISSLDHVVDSWMDFDPPNIETIYSSGPDYPEMNMGDVKDFLPPKPRYFHVLDEIWRIAESAGYKVPQQSLNVVESEPPSVKLKYRTNHLFGFHDLVTASALFGKEYTIVFKVLWYSLMSFKIAKSLIKVGQIQVDGRISPLFVLPAGRGKGQIKNIIKKVIHGLNGIYGEPTSLHGEQLVGKTLKDKNNDYQQNHGYLADDYMVIDEAYQLLTSTELKYAEARKYIRVALDPYPTNIVHKRTTEYGREGALEFTPHCPIALFVQPFKLDNDILVLEGDIRRFTIGYSLIKSPNHKEILTRRIFDESDNEESLHKFIDILSATEQFNSFVFTSEAKNALVKLSADLACRGSSYSRKIANLNDSVIYTSQNTLVKFSAIQALQNSRSTVEEIDVIFAYIDLFEILEHTYRFIEAKIPGPLDYGEGWNGAVNADQEVLRWLQENGATAEVNALPKQKYLEKIMEVHKIKKRQAETIYKKHHDVHGWIEKTKKDKNVLVWLKFHPEVCNDCNLQTDGCFEYENYLKVYDYLLEKSTESLQTANIASKLQSFTLSGCD